VTRSVVFNEKLIAFAKHWGFRPRACARCRQRSRLEIDANSYSVPWRVIGERVVLTVAVGEVRIRHGVREVAVHKQSEGRRLVLPRSPSISADPHRCGILLKLGERLFEQVGVNLMEERGELLLLPFPCDFPYAFQRL
jgi:Mu transposase-like protein